jgi:hypothetical protein
MIRRLSKLTRARLGYTAGLLATTIGAGLEWGVAIGLIVGGAACAASFLLLADVDGPSQ